MELTSLHISSLSQVFNSVSDAADRFYSHVFVTTKALPEITPMASILGPLLVRDGSEPLPVFVMLQNGFDGERDLYNAIKKLDKGEPKIISTALWIGTNLFPGNIISHVMAVSCPLYCGMIDIVFKRNG